MFEQNTTTFEGGFEQNDYYYSSGSYTCNHSSDYTYHNPPVAYVQYFHGSGYDFSNSELPAQSSSYSANSKEIPVDGDYKVTSSQSFTENVYAGGYYADSYSSRSGGYLDGDQVAGSGTSYSTSSYGYLANYGS